MKNTELFKSIKFGIYLTILCWLVFLVDIIIPIDFNNWGVLPRSFSHIPGIALMPLLHGSLGHIISNSVGLIFLTAMLFYSYPKIATKIFPWLWLLPGTLVWICADMFGDKAIHIGASALIYAEAGFLLFLGIFKRDMFSLFVSVIIIFLYGGMFWGVFPNRPGVSWEGHMAGAIVGIYLAWNNRK